MTQRQLARHALHGPARAAADDRARLGHVVIVSSGAGLRAFPQASVYGGTKAAQLGFGARAAPRARRHRRDRDDRLCPASSRRTCTTTSATTCPTGARTSTRCPRGRSASRSSRPSRRTSSSVYYPADQGRCASSRALAAAGRPRAAPHARQGRSTATMTPAARAADPAAAREVREGAARGRRLGLRAEVRRLPHDRLPRRRRRPPAVAQRQADEPLLPRGRRAGRSR